MVGLFAFVVLLVVFIVLCCCLYRGVFLIHSILLFFDALTVSVSV